MLPHIRKKRREYCEAETATLFGGGGTFLFLLFPLLSLSLRDEPPLFSHSLFKHAFFYFFSFFRSFVAWEVGRGGGGALLRVL
jgi:hypothetical protein